MRDYAATLNEQKGFGAEGDKNPSSTQNGNALTREEGMKQMSEKFKAMGEQVYVEAEKVEGEQ